MACRTDRPAENEDLEFSARVFQPRARINHHSDNHLMDRGQRIHRAVSKAIEAVNELRAQNQQLTKEPQTRLDGGILDSMSMVNLILQTEQSVEDEFGASINLSDEDALDLTDSPFDTVGTLEAFVDRKLKEAGYDE